MENQHRQVVLVILDGWGHRDESEHNAVAQADIPFFRELWGVAPHALLDASGEAVGLPEGQMGTSEIGHTVLGSGRVRDVELVRIGKAARAGEFLHNRALNELFDHVARHSSTLHLKGLVSDGGVHSHEEHIHALIRTARDRGIGRVAVHVFTDGRDTPPQSALKYIESLERVMADVGTGFIASISGRYYAMDRDTNWDRIAHAEDAFYHCKDNVCTRLTPAQAVQEQYERGIFDEHIEPRLVEHPIHGRGNIVANDGVFFFNFRADRARQLVKRALERRQGMNLCVATMTRYDASFDCPVAFPGEEYQTTLADVVETAGLTQAHIAETEKYAHVTYFFNGGKEEKHKGETYVLIESRKDVRTHDEAPTMKTSEIAQEVVSQIKKGTNVIVANIASPDMVGHTANVPAIKQALHATDNALRVICEAAAAHGATVIITADHGNAECNFDTVSNQPHTAHTTNPVPCILVCPPGHCYNMRQSGTLADIAPTILSLLNLECPDSMTGHSLVLDNKNK